MIHVIGNSHVNNFSNDVKLNMSFENDIFKSHHIGPVIAYNFYEKYMPNVRDILNKINKETDYISLIVGEVDCRLHLPLQADKQNIKDDVVVYECIDRLFICYEELLHNGYKVIVFSTHPTTTETHDMSRNDRPIYDNVERRNNICLLWNKYSKHKCDILNIKYINFYDYLVDINNITKMNYFLDYCHLNSSMCYKIILNELYDKI